MQALGLFLAGISKPPLTFILPAVLNVLALPMDSNELLRRLRAATEDEVTTALEGAFVSSPLSSPHDALEFFNCMIDVLTKQRAEDEAADKHRIAPGFGSTH